MTALLVIAALVAPVFITHTGDSLPPFGKDWEVFKTINTTVQIAPGEHFYFMFNTKEGSLEFMDQDKLTENAQTAVSLVPEWLRANLTYKLSLLPDRDQNELAALITGSPDARYIDEIAFVMAHTSVETLTDQYFFPSLITENARLIYANDPLLDYVEIVELGDGTTLRYQDRDNITQTLPRDIYYWFVVHPKLSDEIPTFVDPNYNYATTAPGDRNYGVSPPTGKYWRDWLFNSNKSGQPLLKDSVSGRNTVWGAINGINSWISASMRFTSDNERPVQPVRIYQKGIGRCGEHQDLRAAAARAALIPTVCTLNPAEDHVWNEFWDGRWVHWDGSKDNPLMYEKGWGKKLSSVWNWRGDGYTWSVTDRYSEGYCNLTSAVTDHSGRPVEGATVMYATENYYDNNYLTITHWGTTGPYGWTRTILGDQRNFWAQADGGPAGKDPPGSSVDTVITNSADRRNYTTTFQLPNRLPELKYSEAALPSDLEYRYKIDLDFNVESTLIHGSNLFTGETSMEQYVGGYVDFFWIGSLDYDHFVKNEDFHGYDLSTGVTGGSESFLTPKDDIWYGVISNDFSLGGMKTVNITAKVSSYLDLEILEPGSGAEFAYGDRITISGTSFSPWGVKSVNATIAETDVSFEALDVSDQGDPPYAEWIIVIDSLDLGPGQYFYTVCATDGEREYSEGRILNIEDRTPPSVTIEKPDDKLRIRQNGTLELLVACADDHRIRTVEYYFDSLFSESVEIPLPDPDGNYSAEIGMSPFSVGEHTLTVKAWDRGGNHGEDTIDLEITEVQSPIIEITSPESGTLLRGGGFVTISGIARDDSGFRYLEMYIDDEEPESIRSEVEDGLFEIDINTAALIEGSHTLVVAGEDYYDNFGIDVVTFSLDTTPPTIEVPARLENTILKPETDLVLDGWVNDTYMIDILQVEVQGSKVIDMTGVLSLSQFNYLIEAALIPSNSKHVQFTIIAVDRAGWETRYSFSLPYDAEDPIASMVLPETSVIGEPMMAEITISDNLGIGHVWINGPGSRQLAVRSLIGSFEASIDTDGFHPGMNSFELRVIDLAGHRTSVISEVFLYTPDSDIDGDGIPDIWEYTFGLDYNTSDSGQDRDGDGFTNLEEYLGNNGIADDEYTDPTDIDSHPVKEEAARRSTAMLPLVIAIGTAVILILTGAGAVVLKMRAPPPQPAPPQPGAHNLPSPPPVQRMPPVQTAAPLPLQQGQARQRLPPPPAPPGN
ncbi:MAG: Ig-like domain-containing protein [Thermoplasmatota archaeon]